jgi:hypothetical protein
LIAQETSRQAVTTKGLRTKSIAVARVEGLSSPTSETTTSASSRIGPMSRAAAYPATEETTEVAYAIRGRRGPYPAPMTGDAVTLNYGDNLDVLRGDVRDESVDLVYLDPTLLL